MAVTGEPPLENEPDAAVTPDDSGPFQNTLFNRFVATVVGAVWAFCGCVAILRLMQQPWQWKLISGYELAVAAMAMGFGLIAWGIFASSRVACIAKLAGNHAGKLLLIIALPTVIDFVLNIL